MAISPWIQALLNISAAFGQKSLCWCWLHISKLTIINHWRFTYCSTPDKCSLAVSAQSTQDTDDQCSPQNTNGRQSIVERIHLKHLCNSVLVAIVFFLDSISGLEYFSHVLWEGCWWCIFKATSCLYEKKPDWSHFGYLSCKPASYFCWGFFSYCIIPTDDYKYCSMNK